MRKIFRLCIEGYGPSKIARILTESGIPTPTAHALSQGRNAPNKNKKYQRWTHDTIKHILEKMEYLGHTANFKTRTKSYKNKKHLRNPKEEWAIFENTHEPIISQEDFDLVQKLRQNKRRMQKIDEVNPFSGMVYCADCGKKMYLCRSRTLSDDQEHLKCSSYAKDKDDCTAHFIRTAVLKELVLNELNNVLVTIKDNENEFVQTAMERSEVRQSSDIAKAKKTLRQAEKRIEEIDRLFKRLYEDNVSGKISDERFETLSNGYEDEQKALKANVADLSAKIENAEQKTSDVSSFIRLVKKYESFTELTPEIMHELIDKIIVHAPDKSSGHRTQEVEIHFRFRAATAITMADSMVYSKKRKAA